MKKSTTLIFIIFLLICGLVVFGHSDSDAVKKAIELQKNGKLKEAINLLSKLQKDFPNNVEICSYLGFYKGSMAGETKNFMEAGKLVTEAFGILGKAVSMDENHYLPRYHRGILGLNVPEFLGYLDQGIKDLEIFLKIAETSAKSLNPDLVYAGMYFLAQGYEKKGRLHDALLAYKKGQKMVKGEESKKKIGAKITKIEKMIAEQAKAEKEKPAEADSLKDLKAKIKLNPGNVTLLLELAKIYLEKEDYDKARLALERAIAREPKNFEAYELLMEVVGELAGKGYDENVYANTDYRTNLAFEIARLADKACEIAPENIDMRLTRGIIGVQMPFFVNKLDSAIKDLHWVVASEATAEQKAEALFWLGQAHRKKMTTYWIEVVKKYGSTPAAQSVFSSFLPSVKRLPEVKMTKPCVVVDFLLGYQDELPPQTAVWIEDQKGNFVKTVYVSGFSGFAKEKQINLPRWSESSNYKDVDGVTGASIDVGHHIYVWDLKDHLGKKAKQGKYRVRIEVAFWPSLQYEKAVAEIVIGKKENHSVVTPGKLIPRLQVNYYRGQK